MATITRGQDTEALRVEARGPKGKTYVGQGIEVRVGVVAEGERPVLTPPKVPGALITPIDTGFRQIATSGIGDHVDETNLFVSRFRVVPTVAGPLTISAFFAKLGDRSGASNPIRLVIHPVPTEGRPASYLRGVGHIDAKAEASPTTIRLGQPFEYRLILTGPGARGSTRWPTPDVTDGLSIEPTSTELVADPPVRTFHFRIRASVSGFFTLASVPVATFDPVSERYVEMRAPGVSVRVVDVPQFDPASVREVASSPPARGWKVPISITIGVAAFAILLAVMLPLHLMRERRTIVAQRWARRAARAVEHHSTPNVIGLGPPYAGDRLAAHIVSGLAGYLRRATGRAEGALTPAEARTGVLLAVGETALAERAAGLVAWCDRIRFGRDAETMAPLAAAAAAVFTQLAGCRVRRDAD